MTELDQDAARVNAVTKKLSGPLKVWVIHCAFWDKGKIHSSCGTYATKEGAMTAFGGDLDPDVYEPEEIAEMVSKFETDQVVEVGDTTYALDECRVHS